MKKNVLRIIVGLCFIVIGCEDNLEKQDTSSRTPTYTPDKRTLEFLQDYIRYEGSSQVGNVVDKSTAAPRSQKNQRSSVGITTKKGCLDANSTMDYQIDVAVGTYVGVEWILINPLNQWQGLGITGNPDGTEPIWNTIQFQINNPTLFGTWKVVGISYTYLPYDAAGICGPVGGSCTFYVESTLVFDLPLTGVFVSAGNSTDLDVYENPYNYTLPPGKTANDILDIAIDYDNNLVVTWFKDGTRCSGSTADLDSNGPLAPFSLPPGYVLSDIVAIDIDGDVDKAYTWYRNGKRSVGSTTDLDAYGAPVNYTLPAGYLTTDIIDIAIDGNVNWSWVYFKNGKRCAGSTTNLSSFSALQNYTLPCTYATSDIVGIACDGDINTIYAWYKK